jgi:methionyl-tRNA formyltransferase
MGQPRKPLRVLFFGMAGATSATVLEGLLAAGLHICGVVLGAARGAPGTPLLPLRPPAASMLSLANPFVERGAAQIAWEHDLPAFELRQAGAPATLATLAELRPDVAGVACFPRRIPPSLLALAPRGFMNLHPSLLPAHRGPEPLFWTFRAGETRAGATVHFMDERFDTGDIVAQAPIELPDGMLGPDAERACSELGTRLMVTALQALAEGTLTPYPQPAGGSYEPAPTADDFRLDTNWPARRAFNFMRGTAEWGQPYRVAAGPADLLLTKAISFDATGELGTPFQRSSRDIRVQFAPGVLHARLTE